MGAHAGCAPGIRERVSADLVFQRGSCDSRGLGDRTSTDGLVQFAVNGACPPAKCTAKACFLLRLFRSLLKTSHSPSEASTNQLSCWHVSRGSFPHSSSPEKFPDWLHIHSPPLRPRAFAISLVSARASASTNLEFFLHPRNRCARAWSNLPTIRVGLAYGIVKLKLDLAGSRKRPRLVFGWSPISCPHSLLSHAYFDRR